MSRAHQIAERKTVISAPDPNCCRQPSRICATLTSSLVKPRAREWPLAGGKLASWSLQMHISTVEGRSCDLACVGYEKPHLKVRSAFGDHNADIMAQTASWPGPAQVNNDDDWALLDGCHEDSPRLAKTGDGKRCQTVL